MFSKIIFALLVIASSVFIVTEGFLFNNADECKSGDMRPLLAECEWYQFCLDGVYVPKRCPIDWLGYRTMFNPQVNNCTEKMMLSVEGKCQSYEQCIVLDSVSPFGKWSENACQSDQHFEFKSQRCINSIDSTCGNFTVLIHEFTLLTESF